MKNIRKTQRRRDQIKRSLGVDFEGGGIKREKKQ
jgi:hypothetical protein